MLFTRREDQLKLFSSALLYVVNSVGLLESDAFGPRYNLHKYTLIWPVNPLNAFLLSHKDLISIENRYLLGGAILGANLHLQGICESNRPAPLLQVHKYCGSFLYSSPSAVSITVFLSLYCCIEKLSFAMTGQFQGLFENWQALTVFFLEYKQSMALCFSLFLLLCHRYHQLSWE
ncbi:hypothetical protein GOODEAATRI_027777 [Goodea atripinnis]|uniref:Uncharacterized protein n=1 Tax=Goodea atripinnis TaxID=208336 RepID=A0ABV0ML92_9TELE